MSCHSVGNQLKMTTSFGLVGAACSDRRSDRSSEFRFAVIASLFLGIASPLAVSDGSAEETPMTNRTIRIGYLSDLLDPTFRIRTIEDAIGKAHDDGLLHGFNFR
jgi:hypothetical protein